MSLTKALESDAVLIGAAIVGVYFLSTSAGQQLVQKIASSAAGAAAGAADSVIGGTVTGIGQAIGVPLTNHQRCQIAIDSGDFWEASKYCTASELFAWQKSDIQPDP